MKNKYIDVLSSNSNWLYQSETAIFYVHKSPDTPVEKWDKS